MRQISTFVDRLVSRLLKLRNRHFLVIDVLALLLTPSIALMLRTESIASVQAYGGSLALFTAVFLIVKVLIFQQAGLYNRYWKYASIDELAKITLAVIVAVVVQASVFLFVLRPLGWIDFSFPRSIPFIDGLLTLFVVGASRYSMRFAQRVQQRVRPNGHGRRVLVIGAGAAGIMMVREMRHNPDLGLHPVAFVDDDPEKQGMRIHGLDVLGGQEDIPALVKDQDVDLIIIAIASASGKLVRGVVEICRQTGVETKTVPGVYELLDDTLSVSQLRDVKVEDLLRRAPVQTGWGKVEELLRGRRILVTGAGGSIGAELCRQIITLGPAELVLLGHGENSIFSIEAELRRRLKNHPDGKAGVQIHSVIADIRDRHRMKHVFGLFQPQIIFHAAAHKHVPLMEDNVEDAVTNNVWGTRNLLELSADIPVERFILISTDKAVNPTSVMGATKRIAELLVHDAVAETDGSFLAVRFGNVLGSRGSVLQVFREQLAQGGPLTVTHPDVRRYFMTIPESVHLVLQAAAMGEGGEVFLLDMGEPVRIVDLARDLIRLSGMEEDRDIDIVFTGLRPGEKMDERLFAEGERFKHTENEKILVCKNGDTVPNAAHWTKGHRQQFRWIVDKLLEAAEQGDTPEVLRLIEELVPGFHARSHPPGPLAFPESDGGAKID